MNRAEQLRTEVETLNTTPSTPEALIDALNELANYIFPEDTEEGEALAREAFALSDKQGYPYGMVASRITLGFIEFWRGNPETALESAVKLWEECYHWDAAFRLRGSIQELHAAAYHRLGRVGQALAHALTALDLYRRAQDKDGMGTVLNLIGICYSWLDDSINATPYLEEALTLHRDMRDDRRVVMMLGNLAWNYLRADRVQDAYNAMQACQKELKSYLAIHHRAPYPNFAIYVHWISAAVEFANGNLEATRTHLKAGNRANQNSEGHILNPGFHIAFIRVQSDVLLSAKETLAAIEILRQGLAFVEEHQILREQVSIHEKLAQAYKLAGDYEAAFYHHQRFHHQDRELFSTRTAEQVATLRTTLETQAARREAEVLSQKRQELERLVQRLQTLHAQVQSLTIRDSLTGLYNRRYLDAQLPTLFAASVIASSPLALAIADIDNFKHINDTFRHHIGDAVLKTLGELLQNVVAHHAGAFAVRYGGEEVVLVFPNTDLTTTARYAESFRLEVQRYLWTTLAPALRVTLSMGVADSQTVTTTESLLRQADERLYAAKNKGKNQVVTETPEPPPPP